MSIITEALRKAKKAKEDNRLKHEDILEKIYSKPYPTFNPTGWHRKFLWIAVLLLIVIVILLSAVISSRIMGAGVKETVQQEAQEIVKEAEPPEPEAQVIPGDSEDPDLILKGIMYSGNKPLAVINNEIFHENEEFGKLKVINIRSDSVVVEVSGMRKILHLKKQIQ